jgi:hypothetical protein
MNRVWVVIGAGVVAALALFGLILTRVPPDAQLELVTEVAKAAIGIIPVAFLSVIVAELLKRRDIQREEEQRTREARTDFRRRAISAYNRSKAARRRLRSAGFGPMLPSTISPEMLNTLDEQMAELSQAQLAFEQLAREADDASDLFGNASQVRGPLTKIEKYLNRVVSNWEKGRASLQRDPVAAQVDDWEHFLDFTADKGTTSLGDNPTQAFQDLEQAVLNERLGDVRRRNKAASEPRP